MYVDESFIILYSVAIIHYSYLLEFLDCIKTDDKDEAGGNFQGALLNIITQFQH